MAVVRAEKPCRYGCRSLDMLQVAVQQYPPGLRQSPHSHDTWSVTLVLAGSIRERVGCREVLGRPFDLVIKPSGVVHANDFGETGSRTLQLVMSPVVAQQVADANPALNQWKWVHSGTALPSMLELLAAIRHNSPDTEDLAWQVLGAINVEQVDFSEPPRWLQRVRERLDDETLKQPVSQLARDANVHPVYLTRQFRRWFGTSIIEYAMRRRVQRAALLLYDERTLSQVAHQAGFADQAHFCRSFRRLAGMAPSTFQNLVKQQQV